MQFTWRWKGDTGFAEIGGYLGNADQSGARRHEDMTAMADVTAETRKPPQPKTLKGPVRRRVKRYGKRLTRWISAYQSRQSLVPDAPFPGNEHFPFL
jgi:hypothetical protein